MNAQSPSNDSAAEADRAQVVVVDDDFTSRTILDRIVKGIHPLVESFTFSSPKKALEWIKGQPPDLVLVDYRMKEMSGLELVKAIRSLPTMTTVPIIVITSHDESDIRYGALEAGATDFMTKPIDPYECRVRCRNLLQMRQHEKTLQAHSRLLEQRIFDATRQVREREQEALMCLAKAGEYRDEETGYHVLRMSRYSRFIAEGLGMTDSFCEALEMAAPMHDIGKIGIPDYILLKAGRFTPSEFAIMKKHPMIGYRILQHSASPILNLGATIALGHHEKFDGSGYPSQLKGEEISLAPRIVAVADVFDALTSVRPYKEAWSNQEALDFLMQNRGTHFDPECLDTFLVQYEKILLIQRQYSDPNIDRPVENY